MCLTGSEVLFWYFGDITVNVDWFGVGYLIFRAQYFRGKKNSAALLWNCTDSTDTRDIKQLYQIIYFYNSHFRALFTPLPPAPPPSVLAIWTQIFALHASFYLLTYFILPFLASFEQWLSSFLSGHLCVSEFHKLSSAILPVLSQ